MDKLIEDSVMFKFDKEEQEKVYNQIITGLLEANIDHINQIISENKDVILVYETSYTIDNKRIDGFDKIFKLNGLIGIINRYFIRNKINLMATDYVHNRNRMTNIKISKVKRLSKGIVLMSERISDKDDMMIIENDEIDSEEKMTKKIEEKRRFMMES